MTEDTSSENLRKFLESDDPAMVIMGLSMAKGSGVPEELLPTVLRHYMWNDDKTVRAAARTIFFKHAPEEIKAKVKENWKPTYRTLSKRVKSNFFDGWYKFLEQTRPFFEAFKSQDNFVLIVLEPLIKALKDEDWQVRYHTIESLFHIRGKRRSSQIGDKYAIELLIKALKDEDWQVSTRASKALGKMGDERAVGPLIKTLKDKGWSRLEVEHLIDNLVQKKMDFVMDKGMDAVGPLMELVMSKFRGKMDGAKINALLIKRIEQEIAYRNDPYRQVVFDSAIKSVKREKIWVRESAAAALGMIGDKRAVMPLIEVLKELNSLRFKDQMERFRKTVKEALKKLGHEVK